MSQTAGVALSAQHQDTRHERRRSRDRHNIQGVIRRAVGRVRRNDPELAIPRQHIESIAHERRRAVDRFAGMPLPPDRQRFEIDGDDAAARRRQIHVTAVARRCREDGAGQRQTGANDSGFTIEQIEHVDRGRDDESVGCRDRAATHCALELAAPQDPPVIGFEPQHESHLCAGVECGAVECERSDDAADARLPQRLAIAQPDSVHPAFGLGFGRDVELVVIEQRTGACRPIQP